MRTPLEQAIRECLNRYSAENASNTPDFILAQYLMSCLNAWNVATVARDKWYGVDLHPGGSSVPINVMQETCAPPTSYSARAVDAQEVDRLRAALKKDPK